MVVVGQLELHHSLGQSKMFGRTMVLWRSPVQKAKIHWKESWQILRIGEVGEAYRRDAKYIQKVKRVFSNGRRGRWGGWESRWWQQWRAG